MTRTTALAVLAVCAAIAGVVIGVVHLLRRDRAAIVARFEAERAAQVKEAAREIEEDLDDIRDDLRFAGELIHAADSAADRDRELRALLAVVRQYRIAGAYDAAGREVLTVIDPLGEAGIPRGAHEDLAETARRAAHRPRGVVTPSPPLRTDPSGWYRVFATALPGGGGAVALLVDTEPLFGKLRLVAAQPGARLLVLGPHGRPLPLSDDALTAAIAEAPPGGQLRPFDRVIVRVQEGTSGSTVLGEAEARRLRFDAGDAVAAWAPIHLEGGGQWSVATISSTAPLRSTERALLLRLALASGGITLCMIGFGSYVVIAQRRAVALRERLRHASRLAHLHEKTQKILDNIPTGVIALGEDGVITALNRALRERIPAEAVGERLPRAFPREPPAVVSRLQALVDGARASDRVKTLIGERTTLFGREGTYNVHAIPLEPRFPEARVLLVIEDLSDVRALESQLLRAEKLATVGVLAAGIAHEIGTPLGVVRGRAEYLLGKLGADHPQAANAHVIVEQIDRVSRTLRELLDFSRTKPVAARRVALAATTHGLAELLRFELARKGIALEVAVPDDLPPIAADPDQLQQVLVNLIMNACDASHEGGSVRISATAGSPDAEPWARVRIEIADDGAGIAADNLRRVFDPFFTTKKRGQGTGLGLTIAAQIVRSHGGEIELESEPGRGTKVTLLWPAAAAEKEAAAAAAE